MRRREGAADHLRPTSVSRQSSAFESRPVNNNGQLWSALSTLEAAPLAEVVAAYDFVTYNEERQALQFEAWSGIRCRTRESR